MPQPKSPLIDWNEQAWLVRSIIKKMPSHPPGGIAMPEVERQRLLKMAEKNALMRYSQTELSEPLVWPDDPLLSEGIRLVIEMIALHMSYRAHKHYGFREKDADGHPLVLWPISDDPLRTREQRGLFSEELGVVLAPQDEMAFSAAIRLGVILKDRWVGSEWRETLPLVVASIAGTSAKRVKAIQPGQTRQPRKTALAEAKERVRRQHPGLTYKEQLRHLVAAGIVSDYTDKRVIWYDPRTDKSKTTAMSTFLSY